jgi:hypothetical protein
MLAPVGPLVPSHANYLGLKLAESLALHHQTWAKTDGIGSHQTISVASRPLNILHMGLISDVEQWCWILLAHWCQAMPIFGLKFANILALRADPNENFGHVSLRRVALKS